MNGYLTRLVRGGLITLLAVALLAIGGTAFGAYEVSEYDPDLPENGGAAQWTEDFTVQWESPTLNGLDQLVGFAYKWNDSENALTYPSYDVNNYDGFIDDAEAPYFASLTAAEIAGDDSDNLRYLHIQTVYLANGIPPFALSSDVVIGPFNIDNTVSGTFRLPDPDNTDQDLVQTRNPQVTLAVGAPSDVAALFIGETSTFASAAQYPAGTTSYTLSDTTAGAKTIYLWIEDQAGNRSAIPLSASFTLLDPASISPFTATIDLADTDTKTFTISASSGYDWDVINEKDADGQLADVGTIAIISGNETDVTSVTVQALLPGSFQLQAVPNGGGDAVTSGTVTVSQSSKTVTFFLKKNDGTTSVNAISLALPVPGLNKASDLYAAIPNIDGLSKWDVATQSYASYVPGLAFTDFDLVLGEPYFVSVTVDTSFDMTAAEQSIVFNFAKNEGTTSVNAISLPISVTDMTKASDLYGAIPNIDGLSRWDVDTQSYASYVPGLAFTDFDLAQGAAYFVSVNATGSWP